MNNVSERDVFGKILKYLEIAGFYIALFTFVIYGIMEIFFGSSSLASVSDFFPGPASLLILAGIIALPIISMVYYRYAPGMRKSSPEERITYLRLLSVYVLLQVTLSLLFNTLYPGISAAEETYLTQTPPLVDFTQGQINFGLSIAVSIFVPLLIISYLQKFSGRKILNVGKWKFDLPIIAVIAAVQSVIYLFIFYGTYGFLENLLLFIPEAFLLNIAYRYIGLLRSLTIALIVDGITLLILVSSVSTSPALQVAGSVSLFLMIFWGVTGMYSLLTIIPVPERVKQPVGDEITETPGKQQQPVPSRLVPQESMWIRSSCPGCGNASFKVLPDYNLECLSCKKQVDKDYNGPMNIRVEMRKTLGGNNP